MLNTPLTGVVGENDFELETEACSDGVLYDDIFIGEDSELFLVTGCLEKGLLLELCGSGMCWSSMVVVTTPGKCTGVPSPNKVGSTLEVVCRGVPVNVFGTRFKDLEGGLGFRGLAVKRGGILGELKLNQSLPATDDGSTMVCVGYSPG